MEHKRLKTHDAPPAPPAPPRVYCVCRQAADDRMMIACDHCDEWLHPQCVHIAEADVPLIDMYICPGCAASGRRTSFRARCARAACARAARPLSRFCSDACGMAAVYARLPAHSHERIYTQVAGAHNWRGTAEWHAPWPVPPPPPPPSQVPAARVAVDALALRARLLQHAEDRQTLTPDGPLCGFDMRLCWSDEALARWAAAGAPLDAPVCDVPKRRCKRHADWSVIRGADIEVNRELQTQLLAELDTD